MKKLYIIVRKDLSPSQRAVQAGHAVAEFLLRGPNFRWNNGTLIYLGVKGLKQLENIKRNLEFRGVDLMKETTVSCYQDVPIIEDKKGNVYSHADSTIPSILEAIDGELKAKGLELLSGDYGSGDYFFCIVNRE